MMMELNVSESEMLNDKFRVHSARKAKRATLKSMSAELGCITNRQSSLDNHMVTFLDHPHLPSDLSEAEVPFDGSPVSAGPRNAPHGFGSRSSFDLMSRGLTGSITLSLPRSSQAPACVGTEGSGSS